MQVTVVGGGVIGCAVARSLAHAGASVTLIEARECGSGASWAAAGMLSPYGEVGTPGPFQDLAVASHAAFPDFVAQLEEETGLDLRYVRSGKVEVAYSEDRAAEVDQQHAQLMDAGVACELVLGDALVDLEPRIDPAPVRRALHVPGDAHVDNRALGQALAFSARRAGVDIREHEPVAALESAGGRVTGVRAVSGGSFSGDLVVLAAGSAVSQIDGVPDVLAIEPVLGELIAFRAPERVTRLIHSDDVYLIQRGSRLLVGATMETGIEAARISSEARSLLSEGARRLVPSLPDDPYDQWSGIRPATRDGLPVLGPDPTLPGLAYACGHFRNGILLTPATAAWAPMLIGQPPLLERLPEINWSAFRVDR